jgi:NAD(P)-dependent dehydrogenase (short-subunit alcohol dehydrogenase family)
MAGHGLLEGQVAAITGASRSIGLAVAQRFAEEGAGVLLADVDFAGAEAAAAELTAAGHRAAAVEVDVTDAASVDGAVEACAEYFGRVDIAVANAGILHLAPLTEIEPAAWQRVIDVNLTGVFLTLRAFGARLLEQGQGGRLIATSSLFGVRGGRENVAYAAAKFGVVGIVQSAAADLAPHGITVNAVAPGQIRTPMGDQVVADKAALRGVAEAEILGEMTARIPLGRLGTIEETADAFVFLASPLARYVTGTTQLVDGGWMVA